MHDVGTASTFRRTRPTPEAAFVEAMARSQEWNARSSSRTASCGRSSPTFRDSDCGQLSWLDAVSDRREHTTAKERPGECLARLPSAPWAMELRPAGREAHRLPAPPAVVRRPLAVYGALGEPHRRTHRPAGRTPAPTRSAGRAARLGRAGRGRKLELRRVCRAPAGPLGRGGRLPCRGTLGVSPGLHFGKGLAEFEENDLGSD